MSGIVAKNDINFFNAVRDTYLAMADGRSYDKAKLERINVALQAFQSKPIRLFQKKIQAWREHYITANRQECIPHSVQKSASQMARTGSYLLDGNEARKKEDHGTLPECR